MGNANSNTDKALSKRPIKSSMAKTEIPFNNLVFYLSVTFAMAFCIETFIVGTAGQIVIGLLCKSFNLWLDAGAPGAY